jgi:hypothetical protein
MLSDFVQGTEGETARDGQWDNEGEVGARDDRSNLDERTIQFRGQTSSFNFGTTTD